MEGRYNKSGEVPMEEKFFNARLYESTLMDCIPMMRFSGKESFSHWRSRARKKLSELLGLLYMERCDSEFQIVRIKEKENYDEIHFTYQSEPGYFVPGCMLKPKRQKTLFPVVICLQGHSTGMHISYGETKFKNDKKSIAGDRDYAVRAVQEGYAAICIEQRYMGSSGSNEEGTPACLSMRAALPALLSGRCAIGERVWDVMRLIDVIEKEFHEIDKNEIICLGNSGGGTVSFYSACMDERIQCAVPSCSVCTFRDSIGSLSHCACNYIPGIARYFDMGDLAGLIAPRKIIVACGKEDKIFPYGGVKESFSLIQQYYEMAGCSDRCVLVSGEEGHRFYADITWQAIHDLNDKKD